MTDHKSNSNAIKASKVKPKRGNTDMTKGNTPSKTRKVSPTTTSIKKESKAIRDKSTSNKRVSTDTLPIKRDPLTLFTLKDTEKIMLLDRANLGEGTSFMCDDNRFTYYVLLNLWAFQLKQASEFGFLDIQRFIHEKGLIACIRECSEASDAIINQLPIRQPWLRTLCYDSGYDLSSRCSADGKAVRIALQLLRFPKRLSPAGMSNLEQKALTDFQQVNRSCKLYDRQSVPTSHRYPVSMIASSSSPGIKAGDEIIIRKGSDGVWASRSDHYWLTRRLRDVLSPLSSTNVKFDTTEGIFTSGAGADSTKDLVSKVCAAQLQYPSLFHPMYTSVPIVEELSATCVSVVNAVPKSYKARRIIAKESAGRQYCLGAIRERIIKTMDKKKVHNRTISEYIVLDNQMVNNHLAQLGSVDGALATIDLSNASDTVRRSLFNEIFPENIVHAISPYLSNKADIGSNGLVTLYMCATAGTACTFLIESLVFFAIAVVAVEYCSTMLGVPFPSESIGIYGDDIVVPTYAAETTIDFLAMLGFSVNTSKSFYELELRDGQYSYFRESCGGEYVDGYDVSTSYFTRKTLEIGNPATLVKLVDMQHKLYDNRSASYWLASLVRELEPRMTYSEPGSDSADLWARTEDIQYGYAPAAKVEFRDGKRRLTTVLTDNLREMHLKPIVVYSGFEGTTLNAKLSIQQRQEAYELYSYMMFLACGPKYATPLDRLLLISDPRLSYAKASRGSSITWSIIKE